MLRWFTILGCLFVLGMPFLIIKYGIKPKPIPVIRPSSFESPEQIGSIVYRQMRKHLKELPILVFGKGSFTPGTDDGVHDRILRGFFSEGERDDLKPSVLISAGVMSSPLHLRTLSLDPETNDGEKTLHETLQKAVEQKQVVVLYGRSVDMIRGSGKQVSAVISRIEERLHKSIPSILMTTVGVRHGEDVELQQECPLTENEDRVLSRNLGCYVLRQSSILSSSKKIKRDKYVAVLEQQGATDFILYTHSP